VLVTNYYQTVQIKDDKIGEYIAHKEKTRNASKILIGIPE
jgi:hypothetical protein